MKNGKKVFTILSIAFLVIVLVLVNSWITRQVEQLSTMTAIKKKDIVRVEPISVTSKAVLPRIDPMNDPLAPVVKRVVPKKKIVDMPTTSTAKDAPKKKYELTSDEKFLIQ